MLYYSLNGSPEKVNFRDATIKGQAPDKGLYFPERIPIWETEFVESLTQLNHHEIAVKVMKPYVGDSIPSKDLDKIIAEMLSFEMPLKQINDNIYCLELFHGPTLAFKDLGARFLSRCMGYFSTHHTGKILVLVATSGDTGGAVADGFYDVTGTEVVILYPSGKVSPVQEKQLTAVGGNIHAIEVQGDFDACQRLVKKAFADQELQESVMLTSANSINVARWISQQLFYVFALSQWKEKKAPSFAVPSGNFGNICSGMLARQSGLPVNKFIAACNRNDVFTRFLSHGRYEPTSSIQTISNAMDVGDPSNFIRIMEIFGKEPELIRSNVCSYSFSDEMTIETINDVYNKHNYILDPHTAVAYASLENWQKKNSNEKGIVLATAHPVKFPEVVESTINRSIDIPEKIKTLMRKEKKALMIPDDYVKLKKILLDLTTETAK